MKLLEESVQNCRQHAVDEAFVICPTTRYTARMPGSAPFSAERALFGDDDTVRDPSQYQAVAVIGSGAYGTVYQARDTVNQGQMVAMKKIRIQLNEDGVPVSTLREVSLLKQLERFEHPNIVRLLDVCHSSRDPLHQQLSLFLVFEFVEQDLSSYVHKCPPPGLSPDKIKDMMFQLLGAIDFLHSHRIVHRDIKPQNILVTNEGQIKLADFGLAKIYSFSMRLTSVVVTLWYRAPEVLLCTTYATPVDIWSCACIFAELYRQRAIFPGQTEGQQLAKILSTIGTPEESKWPITAHVPWKSFPNYAPKSLDDVVPEMCDKGRDLLQRMLTFDQLERIQAKDALLHPYFSEDGYVPVQLTPGSSRSTQIMLNYSTSSTSDNSGHSESQSQAEK